MGFSRELLNVSNTDFSYISFWFSNNNQNYINSSLLKSYILINVYKTIPVAFRSLFIVIILYKKERPRAWFFSRDMPRRPAQISVTSHLAPVEELSCYTYSHLGIFWEVKIDHGRIWSWFHKHRHGSTFQAE